MLELQSLDPKNPTQKSQTSQPSQPQPSKAGEVANVILNTHGEESNSQRLSINDKKGVVEIKSTSSKNKIPSSINPVPSLEAKNSYQMSLQNFETLLDTLLNPFVVKELSEEILVIVAKIQQPIQEGIQELLSLSIPPEIRVAIQDLQEKIDDHLKNSEDKIHAERSIRENLEQLASKPQKKISLWSDLEVLFQLNEIKSLANAAIKKILTMIDQGHTEALREYVLRQLEDQKRSPSPYSPARSKGFSHKVSTINEKLDKSDYGDLSTLLGEVIEQKPKTKGKDPSFLEREPQFYLNKVLVLKNPSIRGTVTACTQLYATRQKDKVCSGFKFTLGNKNVVQIFFSQKKGVYQITVFENKHYKFAIALQKDFLKEGDVFKVELANKIEGEALISPGLYQIGEVTSQMKNTLDQKATLIELIDEKSKNPKYKLYLYNPSEGKKDGIEVHGWNSDKNDYLLISQDDQSIQGFAEFNRTYLAIKTEKKNLVEVPASAFDSGISFHEEKIMAKRKAYKEIETLRQSFKLTLLKPDNRALLNALLQSLADHCLNGINSGLLNQNEELLDLFNQIVLKHGSLDFIPKPEEILIALVKEANYMSFIDNGQNLQVSKTMELTRGAYPYSEKFKGKNAVLFMGPTGAGKSTAVAYLAGAPLESYKNGVNDTLFRVKEGMEQSYPEIGQALSESKTLYPQAFSVHGIENLILGDCPGLNDTRGKDFTMCANIGLDFAVKWANDLKGLVITVPIQYLTTDRGNLLIEVIETIRERFPQLFNEENPAANARVFLLFTKGDQLEPNVLSAIKDGSRFQELLLETEGSQSAGTVARHQIWATLSQMFHNEKIDVLDAKNKKASTRLLTKYGKSETNVDKTHYVPAMQGRDMRVKFGNCIEVSTHTWTHLILKPYLETIPTSLRRSAEEIKEKKKQADDLDLERKSKIAQLEQLNQQQCRLEEVIGKLEGASSDPSSLSSALKEELQKRVATTTNEQIKILEEEIASNKRAISKNKSRSKELKNEIEKSQEEIDDLAKKIDHLENDIKRLEHGETTEQFAHFKFEPESIIDVKSGTSDSIMSRAISSIRLLDKAEYKREESKFAKDIRGKLNFAIRIEKKFRIVPKNSYENEEFLTSLKGGKYRATIEGENYQLESVEAPVGGKKMIYHVSTTWDGLSLPWFKIYHTIPNVEHNESTIINRKNELQILMSQKEQLEMRMKGGTTFQGREFERKQVKEQSKRLNEENELKKASIGELRERLAFDEIKFMLEAQQKALDAIKEEEKAINLKLSELSQREEGLQKEMEEERKSSEAIFQQKRNLAVLILSEWEAAQQLREFSDLVIGQSLEKEGPSNQVKERKALIDACKEFISVYDTHMKKVKVDCQKTLELSEKEKEL